MTKKRRDRHKNEGQEPRFDFDEAKELTVGQAIRKNEEVEAGVLPEDSILDKYVKQHKDEIEADKFATRQYKKEDLVETQSLDDLIQEIREETAVEPTIVENDFIQFDDLESTQVTETPFDEEFDTEEAVETEYPMVDSEDGQSVKKRILYGLLAALGIILLELVIMFIVKWLVRPRKSKLLNQPQTRRQKRKDLIIYTMPSIQIAIKQL